MIGKTGKIITIVLMVVLGTCMHFVLERIPPGMPHTILGNIFPINETSWEHMKMLWFPFLIAGILLSLISRNRGYFGAFVICGLMAMLMILGAFSFYQSYTGSSVLIIDIITYMAIMISCAMLAFELARLPWTGDSILPFLILALLITAVIVYLTYYPGPGYVFLDDTGLDTPNGV